jgi:hypothetical protein
MAVRQCRLIQYWPADRQVRSTRRESLAFTRRMEIRRASAVAPVYCNVLSGDLVNLVLPVLLCLGHAAVNGRRSFFVYLPYLQTNELSRAQNSIPGLVRGSISWEFLNTQPSFFLLRRPTTSLRGPLCGDQLDRVKVASQSNVFNDDYVQNSAHTRDISRGLKNNGHNVRNFASLLRRLSC